jgi:hypothetical protein
VQGERERSGGGRCLDGLLLPALLFGCKEGDRELPPVIERQGTPRQNSRGNTACHNGGTACVNRKVFRPGGRGVTAQVCGSSRRRSRFRGYRDGFSAARGSRVRRTRLESELSDRQLHGRAELHLAALDHLRVYIGFEEPGLPGCKQVRRGKRRGNQADLVLNGEGAIRVAGLDLPRIRGVPDLLGRHRSAYRKVPFDNTELRTLSRIQTYTHKQVVQSKKRVLF